MPTRFVLGEGQLWTTEGNNVLWLEQDGKEVPIKKPSALKLAPRIRLIAEIVEQAKPEPQEVPAFNPEIPF